MAKKQVERKLNNPEAHERINYLLHIATSTILTSFNILMTKNSEGDKKKNYFTPSTVKQELKDSIELAQFYVKTLREVAKKSVVRL